MIDPDETLSAIDAAIAGWSGYDSTVSDDAMRWAPERPAPAAKPRAFWAPAGTPPNLADPRWTEIGEVEIDLSPPLPASLTPRPVAPTLPLTPGEVEVLRRFADDAIRQHEALGRVFQAFARGLLKATKRMHATTAPTVYGDGYLRHRRRCRSCNPAGNPKPLKVNGADYTRRRNRRHRRA